MANQAHEFTITPDLLGEPWVSARIPVTPAAAAPGADHAVLVYQNNNRTRTEGGPLARAVLYHPGFGDTFFQVAHAQQWIEAGIEFYALEGRAHGRASAGLPALEAIYDLRLRNEELAVAMRYVRELGHRHVTLLGHSTGGLQATVYTNAQVVGSAEAPDAVVLNSPWLELAKPEPVKTAATVLAHTLSKFAPGAVISHLDVGYAQWLHQDFGGEWEFETAFKPVNSMAVYAGFLSSVRRLQAELPQVRISQPMLIAHATKFGKGKKLGSPDLENTDVILDPADMIRIGPKLGHDVTLLAIEGGVHDLACSRRPAREQYTEAAIEFSLRH